MVYSAAGNAIPLCRRWAAPRRVRAQQIAVDLPHGHHMRRLHNQSLQLQLNVGPCLNSYCQ